MLYFVCLGQSVAARDGYSSFQELGTGLYQGDAPYVRAFVRPDLKGLCAGQNLF